MNIIELDQSPRQGSEAKAVFAESSIKSHLSAGLVRDRNVPRLQSDVGRNSIDQRESQASKMQILNPSNSENSKPSNEKSKHIVSNSRIGALPQKTKKMADENSRLRIEIGNLVNERDTARDALEKMLSDLITAQSELEEQSGEMARKETTLLELQQKFDGLLAELEEIKCQSTNERSLFLEREKQAMAEEAEMQELQAKVSKLSARAVEEKFTLKDENGVLDLKEKVENLTVALEKKDEQLREKDNMLKEQDRGWKATILDIRARVEANYNEQAKGAQAAIRQLQKLHESAEERVQDMQIAQSSLDESRRLVESQGTAALLQIEGEKRKAEQYLQELQQLRASHAAMAQREAENRIKEVDFQTLQELTQSHAAETANLRQRLDFFKNNSERLSKENKTWIAEVRSLKETVDIKTREIEDQGSIIYALRAQTQEYQRHFPPQ
ncbi:MAG: kinetochore protein slk19 [Icmadophila ericetorum]|nr:kinetochore protein slk19 [Icmadophila ericetorum]